VYRIVTKYQGQVSVEDGTDEGTTFVLKFPVAPVPPHDEPGSG